MKLSFNLHPFARRRSVFGLLLASLCGLLLTGCPAGSNGNGGNGGNATGGKGVPAPGDPNYAEAVSAFFSGTIALETNDQKNRHVTLLKKVTELAPGEPAAWANLALTHMTKNQKTEAEQAIQKAKELAPDKPEVIVADGLVLNTFGQFDEAVKRFQTVVEKDPNNLKALGFVALLADRARLPDSDKLQLEMYERILKIHPDNLYALIEGVRISAQAKDTAKAKEMFSRLAEREKFFAEKARGQLQKLKAALDAGDLRQARIETGFLRNILQSTPGYQASRREIGSDDDFKRVDPIPYLLTMENPTPTPAEPDTGITFAPESIPGASANVVLAAVLEPLKKDAKPVIFISSSGTIVQVGKSGAKPLSLPIAGAKSPPANRGNFAVVDYDNDFLTDIVFAGSGGLRLFRQGANGVFTDVTASLKLPPVVTGAAYTRVEAIDFEADGDLDLLLSPAKGAPVLLQNNGDKTFTPVASPFTAVACPIKAFAWGDIDGDGDADPAFADKDGKLILYSNERSGLYRPRTGPEGVGKIAALAVAEMTGDATVDLVALQDDGAILALVDKDHGQGWQPAVNLCKSGITNGAALVAVELDNNGGIDLVAGDAQKGEAYLSDKDRKFTASAVPIPASVQSVMDLTGDGLLDIGGISGGKPVRVITAGTKKYKWQEFTLYRDAKKEEQATRINSFCIGGEAEMRAGLLYQKQTITHPRLHFGLGDNPKIDVARIIWTTGNAQSEFDMSPGIVTEIQRLGGSCPFLYTWDGKKMVFVTDCIWRSPLGLKINAQATAGATQPEDWVKVRGEQLAPKDGFYNISITGELRETHYFDLVNLMVVDHPADTEIYVDERFVPTAGPILKVFQTAPPQPVTATGVNGQDVTDIVKERDTKYLDDFGRGQYQGVTKDHWVEVALPENAPRGKPLYLIAFGWLHPTDSSINVAIGQNKSTAPPSGLSLETPDASGKWSVAKPGLGFPAGKVKTIVLRIDDAFKPNAPRRLRLRTNLEIFWDQIQWAEERPNAPRKIQKLSPETATLRYRGFSEVKAADASSPELPLSYEDVATVAPMWRDLIGFHTRFGDIKPLLSKVDDRYVIMNAGDEMRIAFKEVPPPPAGWKRDYVVIGDGWEKDGNINTTFGKTVMPYPIHDRADYDTPPGRLEDDLAYKRHPQDWAEYHTRYVTPDDFHNALLPQRLPPAQE